jgi:hypothetical protein
VKKGIGYVLGLALATSVASSGGAGAMSADTWRELLEILPDLKEIFNAAPGVIANDLPSLVTADNDLRDRLNRAKKFHSTHEFQEAEPKLDGDRLFSKDPEMRRTMRDEYGGFVDDEARDIQMLKDRRAEQASHLADYQRLFKRNADFANKAPDLIGRAAMVSEEMAQQLAGILLTAEDAARTAAELISEYQRILGEYDAKIREEEAAHAAHVSTLGVVDAILPKPELGGHGAHEPSPIGSEKPATPSQTPGVTSDQWIRGAINGATANVDAHASRSQSQLSLEQRRMGPIRPMPSQQGSDVPAQQPLPDFSGTMTPNPNSN